MFAISTGGLGCATIRVTDPARSATEQFLISQAATKAVEQLSADLIRDRRVYVDTSYVAPAWQEAAKSSQVVIGEQAWAAYDDKSFLLGEIRARLLKAGVRLTATRDQAEVIVEVRTGGLSIDRQEFLLGIPAGYYNNGGTGTAGGAGLTNPELSIVKSTKQYGFASVAFTAYWRETGELLYQSGPFVGRTRREDWWFFGVGPQTVGDIPPAEKLK